MKKQKDDLVRTRAFLAQKIAFNSLLGIEMLRSHTDGVTLRCKVVRRQRRFDGYARERRWHGHRDLHIS